MYFSGLLHLLAYGRIYWYKKNSTNIGPPTFRMFQQKLTLSKINSETMTGGGINIIIMLALASQIFCSMKINSTSLEKITAFPEKLYVYYNIVFPGLVTTLLVVVVFHRNNDLRKTVFETIKNQILNLSEK